jgi:RNA polymerase-binding transcription factor DksA
VKSIDPKWAWHWCVLLKLRDRMLKDKGDQLGQVAEPLEPHSMSIADSATDEFDHDLALALLSAKQDALNEVNEAIRRIVDGTYGICLETGKPISRARLRAIPWTRFSKEVEAQLEATGIASHAHIGNVGSVRPPPPGRLVKTETPQEEND